MKKKIYKYIEWFSKEFQLLIYKQNLLPKNRFFTQKGFMPNSDMTFNL